MHEIELTLTVNGRPVTKRVSPSLRLLDFLRDTLNLTGAKEGCGAGECGTCSVFIDGVLQKSCLTPVAKAQGTAIVTVEGVAKDEAAHRPPPEKTPTGKAPAGKTPVGQPELSVIQRAFHKAGASQCGYCIPGMVMAATATLRRNPEAGREEIREGLGGNICRCTGYQKIVEAVELARDVMNGARPASLLGEDAHGPSFLGASVRRLDAPSKVSGALRYAGDMVLPGMLHMQVLRSPVPHARIVGLDTRAAEAMEGVEAVLTSADVPGRDGFGVFIEDQPVFARGRVRFVGDAIAAVVAETPEIARRAVAAIGLDLEPLPAVFDAEEAIKPGAPSLHDERPDNLCKHTKIRKGDVEKGLAEADLVVEETYHTQAVEHAYLEPEAGIAYVEPDGTVTVHSPSQNITHHRHMLSHILAMPINKIRMVMSPVGGGFGGKEDMIYQGMLAIAALRTRRPVKYVFTREESFLVSAKRHPFTIRYTMGVKKDGRITATRMLMLANGGAYALSSPGVMNKAAILGAGPYAIDNVWIDAVAVYTNNTPSGAFRSFGAYQSEFATEAHLDLVAEKLGMDPIELRRVNALRDGGVTHTRQQLKSVSLLETLEAAARAAGWEAGPSVGRGDTRQDLGGPGTRPPCSLGARLDATAAAAPPTKDQPQKTQEVA